MMAPMIECIQIATSLIACLEQPEAVLATTNDAVTEYTRGLMNKPQIDIALYDANIKAIVSEIIRQQNPRLVELVETMIVRPPSDPNRGTMLLRVNRAYEHTLVNQPGLTTYQ